MKKNKKNKAGLFILLLVIIISLIGLLFVFESSVAESFNTFSHPYHFLQHQSAWLVTGFILMFITSFIPIKLWKSISPLLYVASLVLLILVFIPSIGLKLNGARRWFSLGGLVTIQPVEFIKFSLIIFFASWMSKKQTLLPFLFLTSIPLLLLMLQPDLGSSLIILSIAFGLFFVAGGNFKSILILTLLGGTLVSVAVIASSYRMDRLRTFFNPELDPQGSGFHIRQITLALGQGGMFGQGVGNSKQKYAYIPETSSDSILAITAEEIGFAGASFILLLYFLLFTQTFIVIKKQKEGSFAKLMATGIFIWISSQTLLNVAAVVALVPLTGIPLPFFSYGGSSLVMIMLATGALLKLSKVNEK